MNKTPKNLTHFIINTSGCFLPLVVEVLDLRITVSQVYVRIMKNLIDALKLPAVLVFCLCNKLIFLFVSIVCFNHLY